MQKEWTTTIGSLCDFTFISKDILNMRTHYTASSLAPSDWTLCVLKPRHLWKGTSIFNTSFIFCASVPGKAGQFFIFCYLGFCTLTKAAFTFSILTLLCTYFEQSSSHLSPIHQRASPLTITPSSLLGFLTVMQTQAGLLKSHFANAQKVHVSPEVLVNFYCESYLFLPEVSGAHCVNSCHSCRLESIWAALMYWRKNESD